MKTISICGKRGFGDLIATFTKIINTIDQDCHLIFYYPPINDDYPTRIKFLFDQYFPINFNVTYEVSHDFYSVAPDKCTEKFGKEKHGKDWIFSGSNVYGAYRRFKKQWQGNKNGHICLFLNNENTNPDYPMPGKWFDSEVNKVLVGLVDNKNYFELNRERTIEECAELLSTCRYAVGVDGAWAHMCNAMRVPVYISLNGYDESHYEKFFKNHPTRKYIKQEQVFELCVI